MAYFRNDSGILHKIICTPEIFTKLKESEPTVFVELTDAKTGYIWNGTTASAPIVTVPVIKKSVLTRSEFIDKIPAIKLRGILTLAETNDTVYKWAFNIKLMNEIDLNNLPTWFTEGITAMVTAELITQANANSFLERV